jgi:ABC-2 type transport system permease protein
MIDHLFRAEFRRYWAELKTYYPDQITSAVITGIIVMVFILLNNNHQDPAFYIGFAYWFLISSLIGEASESISMEKQLGTLDQLLLKPAGLEAILVVKTIVWLVINLVKVVVVIGLLFVILRFDIGFHPLILPIFVLACIGIFGFSLFLAGLTLKYTKTASFESIISYLLLFLTGSIVPLTAFPAWLQGVADFLPITLGINISRQLIDHGTLDISQLFWLVVQSAVYVLIGHLMYRYIYHASKRSGIDNAY